MINFKCMKWIIALFVFMVLFAADATAQRKKKKRKKENQVELNEFGQPTQDVAPSSRNPGNYDQPQPTRKSRKVSAYNNFNKQLNGAVKAQRKRMRDNALYYRKEQRMAKKPRYSDPMYFGHKKKPKIRPVGKRKLCKECGIVH